MIRYLWNIWQWEMFFSFFRWSLEHVFLECPLGLNLFQEALHSVMTTKLILSYLNYGACFFFQDYNLPQIQTQVLFGNLESLYHYSILPFSGVEDSSIARVTCKLIEIKLTYNWLQIFNANFLLLSQKSSFNLICSLPRFSLKQCIKKVFSRRHPWRSIVI